MIRGMENSNNFTDINNILFTQNMETLYDRIDHVIPRVCEDKNMIYLSQNHEIIISEDFR